MTTAPPPQNRETVVFAFDTPEQRDALWDLIRPYTAAETGIRIVGLSVDNEMTRVNLMEEAAERYRRDAIELTDAIVAISQCPDLSKWDWEKWDEDETP